MKIESPYPMLSVAEALATVLRQAEADRNDMRNRVFVGGRQMADPSRVDEMTLGRR